MSAYDDQQQITALYTENESIGQAIGLIDAGGTLSHFTVVGAPPPTDSPGGPPTTFNPPVAIFMAKPATTATMSAIRTELVNRSTDIVTALTNLGVTGAVQQPAPPTVVPGNTTIPAVLYNGAVVASAAVGDTLTSTTGTWSNQPTGYSYQWQSDGANVGTNSNSYVVVAGDSGHSIVCVVTATNAIGSTVAPASNTVSIA
jgi:hypothetical protein